MWPLNYFQMGIGAVAAGLLGFFLHTVDVNMLKAAQARELSAQAESLNKQCSDDKKITEGVSNDYQTRLADLNHQLDALRVRPRPRCVAVVAKPAAGSHAAAEQPKLIGPYGLSGEWLYDFAGEAEKYRLQLIGLQDFVKKVWKSRGQ